MEGNKVMKNKFFCSIANKIVYLSVHDNRYQKRSPTISNCFKMPV